VTWNYFNNISKEIDSMASILIVDDSSTVRDEVGEFLKANGLDYITAVDGKDGLVKLQSDSNIKLILCDVNMPNMDGLTMVEKIRSELGNHSVNIIMLTTESNPSMKERGKAAGIKGWIVKPFRGESVLSALKKMSE
jgi:two-component system, chemotaxis family, chemotaxis protein CheY